MGCLPNVDVAKGDRRRSIVAGYPDVSVDVSDSVTELYAPVGKRYEDRSDLDSGDSIFFIDADFPGCGWREIHDAASDIRPPVSNGNHRALAALEIVTFAIVPSGRVLLAALLLWGCMIVPSAIFLPENFFA
jgi:hypothetical protein